MPKFFAGLLVVLACSFLAAQTESTMPEELGKVYWVGGDVKPPRVILSPQPAIGDIIDNTGGNRKKRVAAGTTILSFIVDSDGSVRKVKVVQSLKPDLDAKAIEAVKQWKFEPATKKGVPVAVELQLHVDFHLYK